MRKAGLLATFVVAAAALLAVFATNSYAFSGHTVACAGCHSGTGVTVTATPMGTNTTSATYNVAVTGGTEWAVFDGTNRVAHALGTTGQFIVPVGKMYDVFAVKGPLRTNGLGQTTVSPAGPPSSGIDTSTPDTTPTVTTSDALGSYVGTATVHLTATDNLGGWGVAYIYYRIDDQPIRLTRVLPGVRIATSSFTLAAPASGSTTYTVSYWAQDNYGIVEVRNFKDIKVAALAPPAPPALMPVYRFYNVKNGTHFYTASEAEKANVLSKLFSTYRLEGVAYGVNTANPANSAPLYRFYNLRTGVHFYTASEAEKTDLVQRLSATYRLEGVAYNVSTTAAAGALPVYRFYNMKKGVHFYTASAAERDNVKATMSGTYRDEGTAFYVGQ
jgi:hypothetical protein